MYVAINDYNHIVAWHERRKVVERYIANYYACNGTKLSLRHMKRKKDKSRIERFYPGLYLTPYNKTFVQLDYIDSIDCLDDGFIDDELFATEMIYRVLEIRWDELSKKDKRVLVKAINIMHRDCDENLKYTPTIQDLESMKINIDRFRENLRGE